MATLKERLALAAVLLEEARKMFAQREREYDEVYREAIQGRRKRVARGGGDSHHAGGSAAASAGPGAVAGGPEGVELEVGMEAKILAALQQAAPNAKPYRDIADEAGLDPEAVRTVLYRMQYAQKVEKAGRGLWKFKAAQASA